MRRPLCAFCLSALGVLALCSFLPQMGLLLPSAAIFVVFCLLVWWKGGAARGYAVCLLLGAVLGVGIMKTTGARLAKIQDTYAGKEVALTAEVESTGRAYTAGRVSAVLMVEKVDGEAVHFRVECASLPKCEAGGRIRGRFSLDVPDATQRLDDYADGIVLSAEYLSGMLRLGSSESFRTARLQAALSRALRKGMAENTGGVLAAMVVGDRSHLTSTLRSAYRGAGLSHVLVVSGLHVTIFCGLLDALEERLIDAASALSGSGPAFMYMFVEALADGAVACGLPRAKAVEYAAMTMAGSAEMLLATRQHPGALKDAVCSPGGSTIVGVQTLENHGFRSAAMDCVIDTYRKNKELGK